MSQNKNSMSQASGFLPKIFAFVLLLALTFNLSAQDEGGLPTDPAVIAQGAELYKVNCTQCHDIHTRVIGPALQGVNERRPTEWLVSWIKNSQKMIQNGDEYAVNLWNEYNKTAMPAYPFTDEQVLSILSYIQEESAKEPVTETAATGDVTADGAGGGEEAISSGYLTAVLIVLVVVLVLILIVLGLIISLLTNFLKEKKDLTEDEKEVVSRKFNFRKFFLSDWIVGGVVFIFTAVVLKALIDGAFNIGVQQGYQPTQPILFSHELHAGQYDIDCNYCHTGVRISKTANIPSPNICMNCHSSIMNVGGESGVSPEIQKIYDAIDYNPETGEYGEDVKPIEWVRVHNLPDLAYFNHSQHVQVGGIECETCHGPIREMSEVYQYAPLTMGWCINCHRQTEVNAEGNEYYTRLVELHDEYSKEPLTVEDIGGTECSKCHY